jgi:hypothetical protein
MSTAGKRYQLEIYEPGGANDVRVFFESDTPFQSFQRDDLINPRSWHDDEGRALRVVSVEHIIWDSQEGVKHKLCVFTETVKDTAESLSAGY